MTEETKLGGRCRESGCFKPAGHSGDHGSDRQETLERFFEELEMTEDLNGVADFTAGCLDYGYSFYDEYGQLHEVSGHKCAPGANHDSPSYPTAGNP